MNANRYEINTLLDFLKVPTERLAACLIEFESFLVICRAALETGKVKNATFEWIDDGEDNIHVQITSKPLGEVVGEKDLKGLVPDAESTED